MHKQDFLIVLPFQTERFATLWANWCKHALYEGDKMREQAQLMIFQAYSEPIVYEAILTAMSAGYVVIKSKLLDSVISKNKPQNNHPQNYDGIDESKLTTIERIKLYKMRNGGSIF